MRKKVTALILLLWGGAAASQSIPVTTVEVKPGLKIQAEIAYTDEGRAFGLMFRKSLPNDAGMLFLFPQLDQHPFWMKNTYIPLDMIWMNERKEIVYLTTAEPCRKDPCPPYVSFQKALYVLEVNAGFAAKQKLKIGDRMEFLIPPEIERSVAASAQNSW